MVSKTLICVFVAMCCAQAFVSAAPSEESALKTHSSVCLQTLRDMWKLHLNISHTVIDFIKIIVRAKIDTATCESNKNATPDEIEACKRDVGMAEEDALNFDVNIIVDDLLSAYQDVKIFALNCM